MARVEQSTERHGTARVQRFARIVAIVAGVMFLAFGAWAFLAPRAFFDSVAVFEPYNQHFIHDIGAFQVGLGAVLLLGLYLRDALLVSLSGVGVGATLHAISHVIDRDAGGKPASDIPLFVAIALLLLAAAAAQSKVNHDAPGDRADP